MRAELRSILVDTRKIEEDSARSRVYRPQSYESFFKKKFLQRRLMKDCPYKVFVLIVEENQQFHSHAIITLWNNLVKE